MAPAAERLDPLYAAVRLLARFWVWFFYRRVEVRARERVPPSESAWR